MSAPRIALSFQHGCYKLTRVRPKNFIVSLDKFHGVLIYPKTPPTSGGSCKRFRTGRRKSTAQNTVLCTRCTRRPNTANTARSFSAASPNAIPNMQSRWSRNSVSPGRSSACSSMCSCARACTMLCSRTKNI